MKRLTLNALYSILKRDQTKRDKQVRELQGRVLQLERELQAAQSARTKLIRDDVVNQFRQFLQEERARDLHPLVKKEMESVEGRLLEQLKPQLVDVRVTVRDADGEVTTRV